MQKQIASQKNILGLFLFSLALLMSMSFVLGAVSVVAPATGANVTGNFVINCSYVNGSDILNPIAGNTSFQFNGSGSWQTFSTITNFAVTSDHVSATVKGSEVTEGSGSIKCLLGNATQKAGYINGTSASITIYDNLPSCSFTYNPSTGYVKYNDIMGLSTTQASTKDTLTTLTYNWTLYDPNNNVVKTTASASPTFSDSDFNNIGENKLGLVVTDGFGNTNACSNVSIFVKTASESVAVAQAQANQNASKPASTNVALIVGIFVIMIIIIACIGFYLISEKKKR